MGRYGTVEIGSRGLNLLNGEIYEYHMDNQNNTFGQYCFGSYKLFCGQKKV